MLELEPVPPPPAQPRTLACTGHTPGHQGGARGQGQGQGARGRGSLVQVPWSQYCGYCQLEEEVLVTNCAQHRSVAARAWPGRDGTHGPGCLCCGPLQPCPFLHFPSPTVTPLPPRRCAQHHNSSTLSSCCWPLPLDCTPPGINIRLQQKPSLQWSWPQFDKNSFQQRDDIKIAILRVAVAQCHGCRHLRVGVFIKWTDAEVPSPAQPAPGPMSPDSWQYWQCNVQCVNLVSRVVQQYTALS